MAELPKLSSGNTVSVGCKIPNGIHMDFLTPGKPLRRVTLRGTNASRVIGGFGITENVPKEFFDEWMRLNAEHPAVVNGFIFSMNKTNDAEARATEMKAEKNGFEPLDPDKPGKDLKKFTVAD
jgi:glutamate synthase domain-containing protein 1